MFRRILHWSCSAKEYIALNKLNQAYKEFRRRQKELRIAQDELNDLVFGGGAGGGPPSLNVLEAIGPKYQDDLNFARTRLVLGRIAWIIRLRECTKLDIPRWKIKLAILVH